MKTNTVYSNFLDNTTSSSALKALAVRRGLEYATNEYYYVSPAFVGSSEARDRVGKLMAAVFSTPTSLDTQFKNAVRELSRDYDI